MRAARLVMNRPSYDAVILGDVPLGYWPLSESSGSTAADLSGNSHPGTFGASATAGGGASWFGGTPTALFANNANSYVDCGTGTFFSPEVGASGKMTVECWFNYTTDTGTNQVFLGKMSGNTNQSEYRALVGSVSPGPCLSVVNSAGTAEVIDSGQPVALYRDGQWHHFVATVDIAAPAGHTYIDGSLVASTSSVVGSPVAVSNPFRWGQQSNTSVNWNFVGSLSHGAIYGTVLSAARVLAHYEAGISQ